MICPESPDIKCQKQNTLSTILECFSDVNIGKRIWSHKVKAYLPKFHHFPSNLVYQCEFHKHLVGTMHYVRYWEYKYINGMNSPAFKELPLKYIIGSQINKYKPCALCLLVERVHSILGKPEKSS